MPAGEGRGVPLRGVARRVLRDEAQAPQGAPQRAVGQSGVHRPQRAVHDHPAHEGGLVSRDAGRYERRAVLGEDGLLAQAREALQRPALGLELQLHQLAPHLALSEEQVRQDAPGRHVVLGRRERQLPRLLEEGRHAPTTMPAARPHVSRRAVGGEPSFTPLGSETSCPC